MNFPTNLDFKAFTTKGSPKLSLFEILSMSVSESSVSELTFKSSKIGSFSLETLT